MLVMTVNAFTSESTSPKHFLTRINLELQMRRGVESAEREHRLEVKAAEQRALLSFVRSMFDIFGRLVWRTSDDIEEPRLCFSADDNRALDDLLQGSASEQPLDVLLGARPTAPGSDRDRWHQERQRLWTYIGAEVGERATESAEREHLQGQGMARNVAVTCRTADGQLEMVDLFVAKAGDDMCFGVLRGTGERLAAPPPEAQAPPALRLRTGHRGALGPGSASS